MERPHQLPLGDLLDQLFAEALIDACHLTKDTVTIIQGVDRHSFARAKARPFLEGMLRGRSWNGDGATARWEGGVPTLRSVESGVAVSRTRPDAGVLNDLLRIAVDMEIIERFDRSHADATVTVSLAACETQLSEDETFAFLTECILHRLAELRSGIPPHPAGHGVSDPPFVSGAWSSSRRGPEA